MYTKKSASVGQIEAQLRHEIKHNINGFINVNILGMSMITACISDANSLLLQSNYMYIPWHMFSLPNFSYVIHSISCFAILPP